MVRKPEKEQDQEATELIDRLKKILGCDTDESLAIELSKFTDQSIQRNQFSKWRANGLPKNVKILITYIISTN